MSGIGVIGLAFLGSLAAGLATGVGALPILFIRAASERLLDGMLGFAAGVMLAATFFSLLVPAIEAGGVWITVAGLIVGAVLLRLMDSFTPHMHFILGREGPASNLRRIWLLIFAITLHNLPEGLSVGIIFGSGDVAAGVTLATAIGLQNMPEGLAVALPLVREGYSRRRALGYATVSGLVEPVAGLAGALAVAMARPLLPLGLASAAGAMLYVIFDEMIPESHRQGHERVATFGAMTGFAVMMVLDTVLG